jgi:hypothetical protein
VEACVPECGTAICLYQYLRRLCFPASFPAAPIIQHFWKLASLPIRVIGNFMKGVKFTVRVFEHMHGLWICGPC